MSLSNILFNSLAVKLKLETLQIEEEILYTEKLLKKVSSLKKLKENNYKNLNFKKPLSVGEDVKSDNDFFVMYIINISFLRANTTIHVSDIKGNIKLFYTAGSVDLAGKQKKQRSLAVSRLISLLVKKATFLKKKPLALHLNNVTFHKPLIVNKLKRNFFVKIIKSFNQAPYNGCRKKKIRRKKYAKNLRKMERWLSGLKRQIVNLLRFLIVGSNPTLS
jgi:ribosomal protein S11